jgi:DHA3 family multidrug efflux protein-like MFS transporter
MGWAYALTVLATAGALVHILTVRFDEPEPERDPEHRPRFVEIGPALEAIRAVPGLAMLNALAACNNLLSGVFMALMDAYGLELVSVQAWGLLWGFISLAFIAGGVYVTRYGLGRNPLRLIIAGNLVNWFVCSVFTIRSSVVLIAIGMVVWLGLIPVIEAAEQTILQRAIPFERQGRVFGFAQLVENAASPLTAFLMAPLAESVFMPLMTDGRGADLIGDWFGRGPERGIALLFTISGVLGVVVTIAARMSRSYRRLSVTSSFEPEAVAAA